MLNLRTAIKVPLRFKGIILFHMHQSYLSVCKYFGIVISYSWICNWKKFSWTTLYIENSQQNKRCNVTLFWHGYLSYQKPKQAKYFRLPSQHNDYQQHGAHNDIIVTHTIQTAPEMLVKPHREYCIMVGAAAFRAKKSSLDCLKDLFKWH